MKKCGEMGLPLLSGGSGGGGSQRYTKLRQLRRCYMVHTRRGKGKESVHAVLRGRFEGEDRTKLLKFLEGILIFYAACLLKQCLPPLPRPHCQMDLRNS
jgi:hypothetical protein